MFISTENLSIFDLGDELEIMVDDGKSEYYRGRARVVRSARVLTEASRLAESGFGLMFLEQEPELKQMISARLGSDS